ncbi:hypothetical protein TraAM80_02063 [Trypanosoma rangeli]|uniref:Uncharacterized protein n=1 Tax=Trypanosoma rangeli TaxID=5698 RepID=A0A3R7M5S6_TRYRA|nr:uncharacterized protein TraAM80_02063 [Trypanosoma rangeli]RNF09581.1 hypothetical protein TraAM80_02063 [Trypanosoma rangeli]|eukprot:RNF09581.1 hypothetical protein TraAM80_02063 [Trypanosoma rangeli]
MMRSKNVFNETTVSDSDEVKRALEVTNGARNHFVDDPNVNGVAYFVVDQKIMRAEAIFTGENWTWAFISDSCRFSIPVLLAYVFVPSCRWLGIDLQFWVQGRLCWWQLRHPILLHFAPGPQQRHQAHQHHEAPTKGQGAVDQKSLAPTVQTRVWLCGTK